MRNDKFYFLTFLSISIIYTAIASVELHYLIKASTHELLQSHLQYSKKEAKTFATLVWSTGKWHTKGFDYQSFVYRQA